MNAACVLLVAAAMLAGCAGDDDETALPSSRTTTETSTAPPPTESETQGQSTFRVYFLRDDQVAAAGRHVNTTPAVGGAAMGALLAGPNAIEREAGLVSEIPSGTRLLGLSIADGVATADFSGAFSRGGTTAAAQVVHTLTQFPSVHRVRVLVDGSPFVDPPVGRTAFEEQAPPILVESPTPGATTTSPLRVRGTSNTFEATMFLRLLDASGEELVDELVTATSGSGERGTFDATLRFHVERDGPGTLVAYERSAEDGSEIHVVRVPIQFRR